MNETIKNIQERRSIRSYSAKQIGQDDLKAILNAAIMAPNAMNMQKWHLSVIKDGDLLDRLVETVRENMPKTGIPALTEKSKDPSYHTFYHAPTVIMISGDTSSKHIGIDCGAAAQNIALAAQSLGIGSCLIASSDLIFAGDDAEALKKELKFPEGYEHVICVALGYAEGEMPVAPQRNQTVFDYFG